MTGRGRERQHLFPARAIGSILSSTTPSTFFIEALEHRAQQHSLTCWLCVRCGAFSRLQSGDPLRGEITDERCSMDGLNTTADGSHVFISGVKLRRLRSRGEPASSRRGGNWSKKGSAWQRWGTSVGPLHRLQEITAKSRPSARFIRHVALTTPVSFRSNLKPAAYKW